jgi:hypothetical protein
MAMEEVRSRPTFAPEFTRCVSTYALDVAASAFLFVSTSFMAGRIWRFPFDDEIYTLWASENYSALLFTLYPGESDVHPPLSYFLFGVLNSFGANVPTMRFFSLAMTTLSLSLFHVLALMLMAQRNPTGIAAASRIVTSMLFGLCPLAVSQGDALRWYPLFAGLFSLFVTLYIAGGNRVSRLGSAVALGLATSTNILAGLVAFAFAVFRYGIERRWRASFDLPFWGLTALFGSAGAYTVISLLSLHYDSIGPQMGNSTLRAALTDALGFFGGAALGVSQAWVIVPTALIAGVSMIAGVDLKRPNDPRHFLLLILSAAALTILPGLAKPRSFLYLAPVVVLLIAVWLDRQIRQSRASHALWASTLLLATSVAAIANVNNSTHPFKRNSVIPYQSILDFIDRSGTGRVLVVSSDPIIPWALAHRSDGRTCASYFLMSDCFDRAYDSIFLVHGHSSSKLADDFYKAMDRLTSGHQRVATIYAGHDDDAGLKSRLTGVALETQILTVDLYRVALP